MHRLEEIKGVRPSAPVDLCHLGANSLTLDADSHSTEKRKNPWNHKEIQGFSLIGPAGFEPTTSTTPRKESADSHPRKTWVKRDSCEPLHQILHQISKLVEHGRLETLAEVLVDSLEPDSLERLANAISRRVAKG